MDGHRGCRCFKRSLPSLTAPSIRKVAIANPEHAPYGRAAKAALEHAKLWDTVKDKLVFGENIAQTAQFIETGNAEAGMVALSLVLSPKLAKKGKWVKVPETDYPRLEQAAVLTTKEPRIPPPRFTLSFCARPRPGRFLIATGFCFRNSRDAR